MMRDRKPWWQTTSKWENELLVEESRKKLQDAYDHAMGLVREEKAADGHAARIFASAATSGIEGLDVADEIRSGVITFKSGTTTRLTDREKMLMASVVITLRTS